MFYAVQDWLKVLHILLAVTVAVHALTPTSCPPPGGSLTENESVCRQLDVLRNYAYADGVYELTTETCPLRDPYYKRLSQYNTYSDMYLYRLTTGKWGVYNTPCSEVSYGMTRIETPKPWTTTFDAREETTITCTELEEQIEFRNRTEGGEFFIPYFTQADKLTHVYNVMLPPTVEAVTITTQNDCLHQWDTTVQLTVTMDDNCAREELVTAWDTCSNKESLGTVAYNYSDSAEYRGFRLELNITRETAGTADTTGASRTDDITIAFRLQHTPLTTVAWSSAFDFTKEPNYTMTTTGEWVTTTPDEPPTTSDPDEPPTTSDPDEPPTTSDRDGSGLPDYEYASLGPEDDSTPEDTTPGFDTTVGNRPIPGGLEDTTLSDHILLTLPTQAPPSVAPCPGGCDYHAKCVRGRCVCPLADECAPDSVGGPVCMAGLTFPSSCHARAYACRLRWNHAIQSRPCLDTAETTARSGYLIPNEGSRVIYIVLFVVIGILLLAILLVLIMCFVTRKRRNRKQKSLREPLIDKSKQRVLVQSRNRGNRTSSSTSENYRASPKPRHYMATNGKTPEAPIDPERFSLSGCITPLAEADMSDPFDSFRPQDKSVSAIKRENPPQRHVSATENSVVELKMDGDSGIVEETPGPDAESVPMATQPQQSAPVVKRDNPPQRRLTENSVYEIQPEGGATVELDVFEDPFEDDSHVVTKL